MRMVVLSCGVGFYLDRCEGCQCKAVTDQSPNTVTAPRSMKILSSTTDFRAGEQSYLQNHHFAVIP